MSYDKYLRLVALLIERTDDHTARWEPTSRDGVFSFSLSDFSVRISTVSNDQGSEDVRFQIVNSDGAVIDTFKDVDAADDLPDADRARAYRDMEFLYKQARRQALGVDEALDKMIEELKKA